MNLKVVPVQEQDLQQLILLTKVIAEGKFEIKGDAILTVGGALRYLAALTDRFKNAQDVSAYAPAVPILPDTAIEVDTSNVKGGKRGRRK